MLAFHVGPITSVEYCTSNKGIITSSEDGMVHLYNRSIHIFSYNTDPINIFHGIYGTDSPPIWLSNHRANHYNSLIDPHGLTTGDGLGFSSLEGKSIDKDQVKASIKAQQDQQIENALLSKGHF